MIRERGREPRRGDAGRGRRLLLLSAAACWLALPSQAFAAPPLQLPWPTGQVHRINNAGDGYDCGGFHAGRTRYAIDFDHAAGQPVSAVAAGTAHSGSHAELGNYVWIDHGGGLVSVYAHFSSFSGGYPRAVAQGEVLGGAGATGAAAGVHLHFVMRSGASGPFDGTAFLPEPMSGYSGFGAYGCGRGTSPPYTSKPPVTEGSFVAREGSGAVYRLAGGAPIYVSDWAHFGGPQPVTVMAPAQFDALASVPANGTFIHTVQDGAVYRVAGGAPIYVSHWSTFGGPQPTVGVDKWALDNVGHPAAHLRAVPADGTFISSNQDGAVYRVAGGAPIYVSQWQAVGGQQPTVGIDKWAVDNPGHPAAHLRAVPSNGTFLEASSGAVYRVAGGAPIYVSDWALFGGIRPYVRVDRWAIENPSHPAAHLRRAPMDGTVVRGLPSHATWRFLSGQRAPSASNPSAVDVDDVGLAAFTRSSAIAPASSTSPGVTAPAATDHPAAPGATLPVRARVRKLRWAGRTLRFQLRCPATSPSRCTVRVSLRTLPRAGRRSQTVARRSLRLAAGERRAVKLRARRGSQRRLQLRLQTVTARGSDVVIRAVPRR